MTDLANQHGRTGKQHAPLAHSTSATSRRPRTPTGGGLPRSNPTSRAVPAPPPTATALEHPAAPVPSGHRLEVLRKALDEAVPNDLAASGREHIPDEESAALYRVTFPPRPTH